MFVYAAITLSIIGLVIATYTDLKERIVHDKLNFFLGTIALIIYGTQSFFEISLLPIMFSCIGLIWGFLFGWILWKVGVFAGGDVKLFMALGALNPFTPALLNTSVFSQGPLFLFPISLFILSLIAFLPYGFVVILYKFAKNKKARKIIVMDMKKKIKEGIHVSFFLAAGYVLVNFYSINNLVLLPIVFAWAFLRKKKIFVTILVFLIAGIINLELLSVTFFGTVFVIVILYGTVKLMFSMRLLLSKEINIKDLEEGMIPAKSLAWKDKKVVELEPLSLPRIIKYAKEHRINELFKKKEKIISAMKARGLTIEELAEVKKLSKKGLIGKKISIKESMPFVPTILIGYILAIFFGDFLWFLYMGV